MVILLDTEGNCYNGGGAFVYWRSAHQDLDSMSEMRENCGLVQNITYNNTDRYRVSEAFARHLQEKG